jgi:hypothetical protein
VQLFAGILEIDQRQTGGFKEVYIDLLSYKITAVGAKYRLVNIDHPCTVLSHYLAAEKLIIWWLLAISCGSASCSEWLFEQLA